jgi:hypothetical protein
MGQYVSPIAGFDMLSDFEGYSLDLVIFWVGIGVGLVVTSGVFLAGQWSIRRLSERRTEPRRWGNQLDVQVAGPMGESFPAKVVNRSQGGVALLLDVPAESDTILAVRACDAPPQVPWVRVCVRHCHPEGKKWLLGCRFEERVPWSVMVWFG